MRVHVLTSPRGGDRRSRSATSELLEELRQTGHDITDLTGRSPEDSAGQLRRAVANGDVERLLVCGGDGLVHLAIQELAETDIPVAIAPTGTGNDFAAALGVSEADPQSVGAEPVEVDLLKIELSNGTVPNGTVLNGGVRWGASIAIAGFPAAINARANRLRLPLGSNVYAVAAVLELPRFRRTTLTLRLDGEAIETDSAMLAIGNTALFGGGMLACPGALPNDGLLHLTSIEAVGRLGIMRHLLGRTGGTADRPEVLRRTATRIDVDTPNVEFWADGEQVGMSPLSITIAPRALRVATFDET